MFTPTSMYWNCVFTRGFTKPALAVEPTPTPAWKLPVALGMDRTTSLWFRCVSWFNWSPVLDDAVTVFVLVVTVLVVELLGLIVADMFCGGRMPRFFKLSLLACRIST